MEMGRSKMLGELKYLQSNIKNNITTIFYINFGCTCIVPFRFKTFSLYTLCIHFLNVLVTVKSSLCLTNYFNKTYKLKQIIIAK